MKKLLLGLMFALTLNALTAIVYADELPEIAPVDEPAIPSTDAPATELLIFEVKKSETGLSFFISQYR